MTQAQALPPPGSWPATDPQRLAAELRAAPWTLVEFWAPDNLFCRLMAPIRRLLPQSHGQRVRLLCCVVEGDAQLRALAAHGVRGLPELALYLGSRCVRRWRGAVDVHVLRNDLDVRLARSPA